MNWFKRKKFSNKNLSLLGVFVLIATLVFSYTVSKQQKSSVAKKQNSQTQYVAKKVLKKSLNSQTSKKYVAKASHKNSMKQEAIKADLKKVARYNFVKKNIKAKQRVIAKVENVKLRANVDLSMDGWNNQHEQIETHTEKVGDDPVGAGTFEDKSMEEELAAAGI